MLDYRVYGEKPLTDLINLRILMDFFTGPGASTVACLFLILCGWMMGAYRVNSAQLLEPSKVGIQSEDPAAHPIIHGVRRRQGCGGAGARGLLSGVDGAVETPRLVV